VQESTPSGVGVFQQNPEQDQEWIFSIGTGPGAGVIFNHTRYSTFEILCFLSIARVWFKIFSQFCSHTRHWSFAQSSGHKHLLEAPPPDPPKRRH